MTLTVSVRNGEKNDAHILSILLCTASDSLHFKWFTHQHLRVDVKLQNRTHSSTCGCDPINTRAAPVKAGASNCAAASNCLLRQCLPAFRRLTSHFRARKIIIIKKKLFLNVSLMRHFFSYFQGNSFSAAMLWCRLTETDPSCSPDVFSNRQTSASPFFCRFSRRKKKKDQSKLIKEKINWLSNSAARGIGRSPAVEAAVTWFTQRTLSGSSWEGRDERSSLTLSGRTVKTHHISFSTVGRKTNHLET